MSVLVKHAEDARIKFYLFYFKKAKLTRSERLHLGRALAKISERTEQQRGMRACARISLGPFLLCDHTREGGMFACARDHPPLPGKAIFTKHVNARLIAVGGFLELTRSDW